MGEVPAQPKTTSVDQLQEMLGQTTRATDAIPTLTERAPVAPRPVAQAAPEPTVAPVEPTAQPSPVAQAVPETIAPVEPTGTQLAATQFDEAIAKKIIDDPELQRYTKPYVIPKDIEPQVEKFLSPNGTKEVLAYGTPGSGKTTLRDEWLIRNPDGYTAEINVATTPGKIDLMKSDLETSPKSLVLVDEVDKIPKATVDKIKELRGTPGVQILYTTNDLGKVSESVLNTTKGSQISMSPKITPAQRETYALSLGRQYDLKSYGITPEEVVKRAGNASSFREIRNNVLEGVKIKETPMFSQFEVPSDIGLSSKFVTKLEDFQNNNTPQNIMIIDKSAFAKDPDLSGKLNTMFPLMQIDAGLTKALNSSSTMSPVHRVIISDAADAAAIASKKGLMERSNFTKTPTKLIIEDRYGNLDPAVKNRAIKIGSTDLD